MTAWQIALQQINGTLRKNVKRCLYCGEEFEYPSNHPAQMYCNNKCGRDARYLRDRGRKAHSPRLIPEMKI